MTDPEALAEEEALLRATVRQWLERELALARERHVRVHGVVPDPYDLDWRRAWEDHLCASGWSGLGWPTPLGGKGWSLSQQAIFHEEHARSGAPLGVNIIGHGIVAPTLIHFASAQQQQRFLPGILSNREVWCQGYSEPAAGSDLASLTTRAVRELDGDGEHYVLSGHKIWTSFAQCADWCFVLARTDPQAPRHRGISFLLVDMRSVGVRVEPIRQITGESEFNEVFFDHVRVPLGQRVGAENEGWRIAMAAASFERGTYFIPRQVRFAQEWQALRELARDAQRLCEPMLRRRLAELALDCHLLRLKTERALARAARDETPGPEGSATKVHWSEAHRRLLDLAIEVLGMRALTAPEGSADPIAAQWVRDHLRSRAETILAGTSEIQRNIIAEQILGLPRA